MKYPYCRCIHGKYILVLLLFGMFTFYRIWVHVHSFTFAVVSIGMTIHHVSTKHSTFHVSFLYGYMYVAPQDESYRYCYDLCRELRLFSLRAIWYMYTLFYVFTVVPTNLELDKYHVSVKHTTVSILPCWFFVLDSIFVFLYYWYVIDPPCLVCVFFLCQFVPNFGCYLARRISKIRCRHLERAIMIDHRKKQKTPSYLSVLTVTGSRMCTTSAVYGSRSIEPESLLRRTSLLLQVKETISPSQRCLVRYFQRQCLRNSHRRLCLQLASSGASCGVSGLQLSD